MSEQTNYKQTIFLSYYEKDDTYADTIEKYCRNTHNVEVLRYTRSVPYAGNFQEYMDSICVADIAILMLSTGYLSSINCMYEATQRTTRKGYKQDTIIITINEKGNVYDSIKNFGRVYWKGRLYNSPNKSEADDIKKILVSIEDFCHFLRKTNNPDMEDHQKVFNDVDGLIKKVPQQKLEKLLSLSPYSAATLRDIYQRPFCTWAPCNNLGIEDLYKNGWIKRGRYNSKTNCYTYSISPGMRVFMDAYWGKMEEEKWGTHAKVNLEGYQGEYQNSVHGAYCPVLE